MINDDPFMTATEISRRFDVSTMTILRFLGEHGIYCRTAANQTRLTEEHKIIRVAFCKTLLETWSRRKLYSIIFSDEKTFSTDVSWRKNCYRPKNTRHETKYINELNLSGRINAAYWGAISCNGPVTDIIRINGKFNSVQYLDILRNRLTPVMNQRQVFMHDNSPVHTAGIIQDYLRNQPFETMMWCPMSPDLNPIENVWSHITFNWPKMQDRSDAALHRLVTERWNGLRQKRGVCLCCCFISEFQYLCCSKMNAVC